MSRIPHAASLDCRSCGACCIAEVGRPEDVASSTGWADCTVIDVARLSRKVRAKLATVTHGPIRTRAIAATPTRRIDEFGSICAFLRGTPGRRVSCRVYTNRPRSAVASSLDPKAVGPRVCELTSQQKHPLNHRHPIMTKTLHDKIEIHPSEPAHTTILKMTANATLEEAAKLDEGKTYSPKFYADGWKIAIETPRGILGLWSCWLGNQFHLGYPGPTVCPVTSTRVGALIEEHLGVKQAEPVLQVDATAVDPHYTGEYKDPNKPLEVNALGQTIAYQTRGGRLWATYYGPRVSSDTQEPGRIWVEHSNFCSTATEFRFITVDASEALSTVWYGHDNGRTVHTFPYTFANRYATEGPTANPAHVQPYRDRFLSLACALAEVLGGATAVNVDYGFIITPTQLETLGYRDIRWIKGLPDNYLGWGNEVVLSSRRLADNRVEHLLLRSGNQMVPWAAIRRIPTDGALTTQVLLSLLTF